ncbi:hypothetical protein H6P81_004533 [Aristolochia fimbriata]|uniref:Uncharacterized protein n=1 Tax=Aristolochia fimbriata TaxID=158543 RepID=A0AAV7FFN0_ARIFI|nr:hypothetical protein H6P81_004533 [Aristolochia fimbriata]
MENLAMESAKKRKKQTEKTQESQQSDSEIVEKEREPIAMASEEMEASISGILQKMDQFTERVSELLETGKKLFKEMSDDLEEKLIRVYEEQVEKWTEELKELRLLDSVNEETRVRLHNVQDLLQKMGDSQN